MAGIKTYLFSENGAYLGLSQTTDSQGRVAYTVPLGTYKIRADYLGYQFMTDAIFVEDDIDTNLDIIHQDLQVSVNAENTDGTFPLADISCYLFTPSGTYLGIKEKTNENGAVFFNLPEKAYKVRADYLNGKYWSGDLTWQNGEITVNQGTALVTVTRMDTALSNVPVYVFNPSGSYLGLSATTDESGIAAFELPTDTYRFRADFQGNRYWGEDLVLAAFEENPLEISTGGGSFELTLTQGDSLPMEGVPAYIFNAEGTYLGESATTGSDGTVSFNLADGSFKIRLDYLGYKYWTDTLPEGSYKFRANYQAGKFWASGDVQADTTSDITMDTGGGILAVTVQSSESTVLEGITCYLFSLSGTYLGQSAVTDENGIAQFDVANGSYKVRVDYLGYKYWSDTVEVLENLSVPVLIEHLNINVSVAGNQASGLFPLPGVNCYVFTDSGSYTGVTLATDEDGVAHFSLPDQPYKIRADYLKAQYWSEPLEGADTAIAIPHGNINLAVTDGNEPAPNLTAYLFNTSGTYLGLSGTTAEDGSVSFTVPEGSYQIRVDAQGEQYWTQELNILPFQENEFSLELTNENIGLYNPWPLRRDGQPPEFCPMVASIGTLPLGSLAATEIKLSDQTQIFWYITDHLDTPQMLVDDEGTVVWQADIAPFGGADIAINDVDNFLYETPPPK